MALPSYWSGPTNLDSISVETPYHHIKCLIKYLGAHSNFNMGDTVIWEHFSGHSIVRMSMMWDWSNKSRTDDSMVMIKYTVHVYSAAIRVVQPIHL